MTIEPTARTFQLDDEITLHCEHWQPQPSVENLARAPLILLHGGGANAHWWDHLAPPLAFDRHVYALDFRGHGDSSFPEQRAVGAFNLDLEAMLKWLRRDDVILIGHSMGAAVALDHASRFRQTRGLVLIDLARGGGPQGGRRARLALAHRRTYKTRADAIDRFRFLPESSRPTESIRSWIAERSVRAEPDGRFGYKFDPAWFSLPPRAQPDLTQVVCPSLLVRGSESQLLSAKAAAEFVSRIASGQMVEIHDAGHHVLVDQPDRLLDVLQNFIGRIQD